MTIEPEVTILRGFGQRPWVEVKINGFTRVRGYVDEDAAQGKDGK